MNLKWLASHDPASHTSLVIMWKEVHKVTGIIAGFSVLKVLIDDKHQDNVHQWNT